MATVRTYITPQVPETINSTPLTYPTPSVNISLSPNAEIVSITNNYGTYTYNNAPIMYYHDTGVPLTFTASLTTFAPFTPIEYFWDFGDGTNGTGNPIDHTYQFDGQDVIAHVRVTDNQGRVAWGSLNPMLRRGGDAFRVGDKVIYV